MSGRWHGAQHTVCVGRWVSAITGWETGIVGLLLARGERMVEGMKVQGITGRV